MSETTNLQLKKHDNVSTNTNAFDIENYLNGNWDKIDTAYGNTTTNINAKYTKPVGGIPKTDLDSSVQTSLGKADTAIQTHQDISGKEDKSNKVTSISSESTNTQYPSAKLLYDKLAEKQTEIDNLQTDVEDLRGACYKVEGTGTDITLNNTAKGRLLENLPGGKTSQVQLEGKNLFNAYAIGNSNITIENDGAKITLPISSAGGGAVSTSKKLSELAPELEVGQSYKLLMTATNDYIYAGETWGNNNTKTITQAMLDSNVYMYGNSSSNAIITDMRIIKEIETNTNFEPYCGGIPAPNPEFPQQIKNVTGNANVKIQNKNLFDYQFASDYSNTTVSSYRFVKIADVKKGQQYNINNLDISDIQGESGLYVYITSNPDYDGVTHGNALCSNSNKLSQSSKILNNPTSNNYYIGIYPSNINETTYNKILDKFKNAQLEQGSTATSYVPHQEQNYPFTFAEGQRAMQGTQLLDDGKHQKRKQIVLDGSNDEEWSRVDRWHDLYRISISISNAKNYTTNDRNGQLCSHFTYNSSVVTGVNLEKGKFCQYHDTNEFYFIIEQSTKDEWLQWLAQHPIIIEYELATLEIIPYNATQQAQYDNKKANAHSYDDITIISSESDELGFNMKVTAIGDANKVIDSLDTRLLALESEV